MADIYNASEEQKEQVRMLIKDFLKEHDTSIYKLAKMLNEKYGRSASVSNILNKLARSSFKVTELMDIVALFDCELKIVSKSLIEGHEETSKRP